MANSTLHPSCADNMRGFPHAVPSVVVPTVILDYSVVDRSTGIHRKGIARLVVVMRVQANLNPIGFGPLVAAHQARDDLLGCRIVGHDPHVERLVVVRQLYGSLFARWLPLLWLALDENP